MGKSLLMAAVNVCMAMGVSPTKLAYNQKSPAHMINFQGIAFLAMVSIIIPDMVFHREWLQLLVAWAMSLPISMSTNAGFGLSS